MNPDRAAACLVHFGPPEISRETIAALAALPDIGAVYVRDNGGHEGVLPLPSGVIAVTPHEPGNLGFAEGMNRCARAAREDGFTLAYLVNPDVRIEAPVFERLRAARAQRPEGAIWAAALFDPRGRIEAAGARLSPYSGRHRLLLHRGRLGAAAVAVVPVPSAPCTLWLADLEVLLNVGGFDARLFAYFEDMDLCRRLWAAGWPVFVALGARAWHAGAVTFGGPGAPMRLYYAVRNHLAVVARHRRGPAGWLAVQLPLIFASYLVYALRQSGCPGQSWAAKLAAVGAGALDFARGRLGKTAREFSTSALTPT